MGIYKRPNGRWYIDEIIEGERLQESLGTTDKRIAEEEATKLRDRKKREARGELNFDETLEEPLAKLVSSYATELRRRGQAAKHVETTEKRIARLVEGLTRIAQVTPERIGQALARVAQEGVKRDDFAGKAPEGPLSPKTVNDYRACLSGLFSWLVETKQWSHNPVVHVAPVEVHDRTFERRALTRAELSRLLATAPRERAAIYLLMATSGLRRGEVKALTWGDLSLATKIVRVRAKTAKNRRAVDQPVPASTLAAVLSLKAEDAPSTAPLFDRLPLTRTFYKDLDRAGIDHKPVNGEGRVDVHALRVTYCTLLARAGVSLVQAQKLMRHSDPKLTSGIYSRLGLVDGHAAVATLALDGGQIADRLDEAGEVQGLSQEVGDGKMRNAALTTTEKAPGKEAAPSRETARGLTSSTSAGLGFEPRHAGSEPDALSRAAKALALGVQGRIQEEEDGDSRSVAAKAAFRGDGAAPGALGPEDLARHLLAAAATAPDPRALLDAAQALLEQARDAREAEGVVRLEDARRRAKGGGAG